MTDRIIDISDEPARLSVRLKNLVIKQTNNDKAIMVPLGDLAVLIMSHPQISITQAALAGIVTSGGAVLSCNGKLLPVGLMLPLIGNSIQAERFAKQASVSKPIQKQLWKQIVQAKVLSQARLLDDHCNDDHGLTLLAQSVRSGDSTNIEAQASRRYWPNLFDDPSFRRHRDGGGQNNLLNYGYTVLRAIVARAICAAGLHPSLGIHHHNRYDSYCLASDLMEPFRTIVDRAVVHHLKSTNVEEAQLDRNSKETIVSALLGRFSYNSESRTLFDIVTHMATSLMAVYSSTSKRLSLPEL
ncbi:type II CRISPR-associated endonuclease Cas1 [Thermodesulfobacteriota bacterium]